VVGDTDPSSCSESHVDVVSRVEPCELAWLGRLRQRFIGRSARLAGQCESVDFGRSSIPRAASRMKSSRKRGSMICMTYGRTFNRPTGTSAAGSEREFGTHHRPRSGSEARWLEDVGADSKDGLSADWAEHEWVLLCAGRGDRHKWAIPSDRFRPAYGSPVALHGR
jgi:hypothetical protein